MFQWLNPQVLVYPIVARLLKLKIRYQVGGIYIVMEGPQFSTLAELIYIGLGELM